LKIETFDRDDHQKKVVAEFDAETLERFKHQAARKIASETRIPGFRPGKAPFEMVRRLYGDKAIQDEAMGLMLDEVYPQVLHESGITAYGPGQLDEIVSMDPPKFSFIIPLTPVVELGDYKSIRKDHVLPVVSGDKTSEVIERLRRRTGTAVLSERSALVGDLVAFKLSALLLEPDEGQDATLIEENSFEMVAGTPEDHTDETGREWPFEGFVFQLVGLKPGETKTVQHTFTEDGSTDDLTGKTAEFTIQVESVKEIQKPELDNEFAASLGPYADIEALQKDVYNQLQDSETRNYNRQYFEDLVGELVDGATVKYPPVLINEEVEHMLAHLEEDLAKENLDLETYLKTRELTREDLIEQEVKPAAERRIKRQLVLEEFSVAENIQIQPHEMQIVYDMALTQAKRDPSLAKLGKEKMSTKELADNLARGSINEIFNQRLISRLRDIATGKADAPAETVAEVPAEIPYEPAVESVQAEEADAAPSEAPGGESAE
jgi:trigger factor